VRAPGRSRSERGQRGLTRAIPILAIACAATGAHAHGFGQRFDLPLPLWLWLTGAGATLVLTFAALALFARRRDFGAAFLRSIDLLAVFVRYAASRIRSPSCCASSAARCSC
jgi:hypothetical protein